MARSLEAYFVQAGLALSLDTAAQSAAQRRARRLTEIPEQFRTLVAAFAENQLESRQRARRCETKPQSDHTLEINLAAARDLTRFLHSHRPAVADWALIGVDDVEAFLASISNPANRARQLHALQRFFRFARSHRHILADPTRHLSANSNVSFHGQVLDPTRQRQLYRRWTSNTADDLYPHEPLIGLLGLLHGASVAELRSLRTDNVDLTRGSIVLGRRPHPIPLDPATATALRRCPRPRDEGPQGEYLLVNQKSKTTGRPVSIDYLAATLAPAQVTVQALRATRLAQLVATMDPVLVAAAFGIRRGAVLHYLADTVDPTRLPNL